MLPQSDLILLNKWSKSLYILQAMHCTKWKCLLSISSTVLDVKSKYSKQGCWKVWIIGGAHPDHITHPQKVVGHYVIKPSKSGGARNLWPSLWRHPWKTFWILKKFLGLLWYLIFSKQFCSQNSVMQIISHFKIFGYIMFS